MKKKLEKPGIKDINQGVSTGSQWFDTKGVETTSFSPIDGSPIAKVANATIGNYERLIKKAQEAYLEWRIVPAPKRGEVIRQIGEALLKRKDEPGYLVSLGMGKILEEGLVEVQKEGGKIVFGGQVLDGERFPSGNYVIPAIVDAENHSKTVQEETFAPIVYMIRYNTIEEAIKLNNGVPQGLSSCIFTENLVESEIFLSETGSECGIANVNLGTPGAEIGGAFGGEKDTGGGRKSGSDAWKSYMHRQTNTINSSGKTSLAGNFIE